MPETSVARRGCSVRRVRATWLVALLAAAAVSACGSSARTRTETDTGGAGASTTTTSSTVSIPATSSTPTTPTTPNPMPPSRPGRSGPLTVSPTTGTPGSGLTFSFSPRTVTYIGHQIAVTYGLTIDGPVRAGCIGEHGVGVPVPHPGRVSVTVGPSQLGGHWCTGNYTARVEGVARPVCGRGAMCPEFVRLIASYGPATFRITR